MKHSLSKEQVSRYSRQLLVRDFGVSGQLGILAAKILVVGAGGLGCPVSMYLAGAGVNTIGIVDYDDVSLDNLHRQVAHKEKLVGAPKVNSLKESIKELNSTVTVITHDTMLNKDCALDIIKPYDIVMDCTDNQATRYLLNDACVLLKKPLVSGSALRWEGQLTVYNYVDSEGETSRKTLRPPLDSPHFTKFSIIPTLLYRMENRDAKRYLGVSLSSSSLQKVMVIDPNLAKVMKGPCYRCLFPTPTSPAHVTNCSEGGVLGPVVGVIGSLQALEALKIAAGLSPSFVSNLYLFDGKYGKSRTVVIRPRNRDCAVCGDHPTITQLIDYESFCGSRACDKIQNLNLLDLASRITPLEYSRIRHSRPLIVLIDTRPHHEFEIASLSEAINIPMEELRTLDSSSIKDKLCLNNTTVNSEGVFVICHRGNDSQIAVRFLEEKLKPFRVRDIVGGYEAWATEVDQEFPHY